jgi:hypothetical protein
VPDEGRVQRLELRLGQGLAQVQAADLGSDVAADAPQRETASR